jgi:hypothetical protein
MAKIEIVSRPAEIDPSTRTIPPSSPKIPLATPPVSPNPTASQPSPDEKQPLDKTLTAESANLIDALSKVLAKTILEDPKAWQDLAEKASQKMSPTAEKPMPVEKPSESAESPAISKPSKPDWVGNPIWHPSGNDTTYERDIELDLCSTRLLAEAKLPGAVQKAVDEFVEDAFADARIKVKLPEKELAFLVKEKHEEWWKTSAGDMLTLHARTVVDKHRIEQAYRNAQAENEKREQERLAQRRLWGFGAYFSCGFLVLATFWGYLKLDMASGGKHRGVLRSAVFLVILSLIVTAAMIS